MKRQTKTKIIDFATYIGVVIVFIIMSTLKSIIPDYIVV